MTDRPSDGPTDAEQAPPGSSSTEPSRDAPDATTHVPTDVSTDALPGEPDGQDLGPQATDADRDLLARARGVGELDLAARPDAFEELDSVIVDRLRAIEDL